MAETVTDLIKEEFRLVECYFCQQTFMLKHMKADERGNLCCTVCIKAVYRFKEETGKMPLPVRGD